MAYLLRVWPMVERKLDVWTRSVTATDAMSIASHEEDVIATGNESNATVATAIPRNDERQRAATTLN